MNAYWYGMIGTASGELLSFQNCVIVHDNPHELGWLITNVRVVQMQGRTPYDVASWLGRRVMLLRDHPDLSWVKWPLTKEQFWDSAQRSLDAPAIRRAAWA